ncbi:MAG: 3-phosphoserine/phosphohydroxythreonine transaminase [Chitinivibrionales bacterium]|nr:3-phosphoserine/phosphohydroxythreonine transaminase [Chitinivibrionales bacterium]
MPRKYNFSAGPSILPEPVLQKAASELVDYRGQGMSVMEMSHRSPEYKSIIEGAEASLREIMAIPANYYVLFVQGGAQSQFAMVALNLMHKHKKADYLNTGQWSKKAIAEAKRYGTVNVVASSEDTTFTYIPQTTADMFDPQADYVHITTNNTIYGTCFKSLPETGDVPLVADMSSNILSERMDVSKFGLIYAGAQKNIGPAGVTVVIVRKDLVGNALDFCPTMFNYQTHADAGSMYNTPPTYGIYMAGLVFEWIKELGGVSALEMVNKRKAAAVYEFLDNSELFSGTVVAGDRSIMNVPFILPTDELNAKFIAEAKELGFVNLKGHRTVGGMRASIYNAMPEEGVMKLIAFMKQFETDNR